MDQPAELLARPQHVLDVLGAERHDAADRARAVDVGDRTAHHVDARRSAPGSRKNGPLALWPERWKFCRAPSITTATRPKSCRPRMLIEVSGVSARSLEPDARHAEEQVRGAPRLELVDLLPTHRAHIGKRLDGLLLVLVASTVIGSSSRGCCASWRSTARSPASTAMRWSKLPNRSARTRSDVSHP